MKLISEISDQNVFEKNISLQEEIEHSKSLSSLKPAIVPNIVHYIWFGNHTFRFDHLISILSVAKFVKPDSILLHTDFEPRGIYWHDAEEKVGNILQIVHMDAPRRVYNHTLKRIEHRSDVARLQILIKYGGIYMDFDVIALTSLEPLRHYAFVVGRETNIGLNNGIIISAKNATFAQLYYEGYKNYNEKCWNCNSVLFPNELAKKYPNLVHVENMSLVQPNHEQTDVIFFGHFDWWEGHYTIHTWIRLFLKRAHVKITFTPENIKFVDSAFGELCRYIYYGRPGLIQNAYDNALSGILL
ncbi:uncharacterized protein LOC144452081 [Glandiceps talaboti]